MLITARVPELNSRKSCSMPSLKITPCSPILPRLGNRRLIRGVLLFVIGKIPAEPAHVELRLHLRRKSDLEVRQARGAHDEDDFVFGQTVHNQ